MTSSNPDPCKSSPNDCPPYPTGYIPPADQWDLDPYSNQTVYGGTIISDSPDFQSGPVIEMSWNWGPIDCVIGGTRWFRERAGLFLPKEPREDDCAWRRRISKATLAPFTVRIAEQAAGLILRKGVQIQSQQDNPDIPLDPYWEAFEENVDGLGTDLNTYARRLAISSLLYGHAATLVDYPSTEAASNLKEERERNLRPYFIEVDAPQILGWRRASYSPIAPIEQVRIGQVVSEPYGQFGEKIRRQIIVLEPGKYCYYILGDSGWEIRQEGSTSLNRIPLTITYSQKIAEFISKPPLLPIAYINIDHAQRSADLQHSLHVSALPILCLEGFDDNEDTIGLSANTAILMPQGSRAYYVEPASSAFDAQQQYIHDLEKQMGNLGISTLFAQKTFAESEGSRRLARTDSDSLLSIVSQDLQSSLQEAFNIAGEYIGLEPPLVTISRDFDLQSLDGNQIDSYLKLFVQGVISQETLLQMLKDGETLPNVDIEAEVERTSTSAMQTTIMSDASQVAVARAETAPPSQENAQEQDIRGLIEERLNKLAAG